MTPVEAAAADLLLELAQAPITRLLAHVDAVREQLEEVEGPLVNEAREAVRRAGEESIRYLVLVLQNNPRKSLEEVLSRADVVEAMSYPFEAEAAQVVREAVRKAWEQGWQVGSSQALADLAVWGLPQIPPPEVAWEDEYLASVLEDVQRNAAEALEKLALALAAAEPDTGSQVAALSKVLNDLQLRAGLSVGAATSRAASEAALAACQACDALSEKQVKLLWVTSFRPTTCGTCASLHGTVIGLGEQFPGETWGSTAPKVYLDLAAPPRHPNCGCRIVPYVEGVSSGVSPETMTVWAKKWWMERGK